MVRLANRGDVHLFLLRWLAAGKTRREKHHCVMFIAVYIMG
jgi:hypothetical protein